MIKGQKEKSKLYVNIAIVIALLCVAVVCIICSLNKYTLELSVSDGQTITLEYDINNKMPEVSALYKGTILNKKGISVDVITKGEVDFSTLGSYDVVYEAVYRNQTIKANVTIVIVDTLPPVIELVENEDYFTSPIATYEEEGFSAVDNYDGDLTAQVIREEKDGIVTYRVTDTSGNETIKTRTIVYKDVILPIITLEEGNEITIGLGTDYVEPGFVATDDCDGDLTQAVKVEGNVDGHTKGEYVLTYSVADSYGNLCETQRKVIVTDITAPVLSLLGEKSLYIKVGEDYSEAGYTASDDIDGDITSKVNVSGSVDTGKKGSYTLRYQVSDSVGNTTEEIRTIYVYEKQAIANTVNPGDKVVYLTFDDGPSKYTAKLLDILDEFGVKATFFVTNQYPSYQYMIGETYRRGHTIALHTYTHNYNEIYKSEEAYYHDLQLINDICVEQTGVQPSIVRFPGGTSNTVSRKYCKGIMTKLTETLSYHGYLYCDWNVSSGDAGETTSAAGVAQNVISGIQGKSVSIVLQHDIKGFSVNAVREILAWGIANGYTFLPMSDTTPMVHQKPLN
ncbi:MAG: polysaccharide deacetylase family protein [Lachnospiraceae bacterium]|nr:polysaccharide deacetylase family protein [Lachnospiraceae bacterium]